MLHVSVSFTWQGRRDACVLVGCRLCPTSQAHTYYTGQLVNSPLLLHTLLDALWPLIGLGTVVDIEQ